jgi:chromosome segregation ATPase
MAEAEGAWFEPAVREDRAVPVSDPGRGLESELGLLEVRVAEAAGLVLRLREERDALQREREPLLLECADLRRECEALRHDRDALRHEREEVAARLAQIIAKVDALRGEP